MKRAKGVQRIFSKISSLTVIATALAIFMLPVSTRAALAGVWQTPMTFWLVDGYGFGEYVGYSSAQPYHLGEDAHGDPGTPVYAGANGTVSLTINMNGGGWGGLILLEHTNQSGEKVVSLHGHLDASSFQVAEGQEVSRGQLLGYLGDSQTNGGWVPHLHYGIRNGRYLDAWNGEEWVYYGYGNEQDLADWFNPTDYIESHKHVVEVQRVPEDSPNRYTTAAGISARLFPEDKSVAQVYLANGTSFADALAAAPLTNLNNAPLLLVTGSTLPKETKAELTRVLAKGGTARLLGGEKTIAYSVEQAINSLGIHTERIAGNTREGTATRIAKQFPNAKSVFIVNRDAFPDAVSAGGPSNLLGLPLLFTGTDSLNDITERYLKDHPTITTAYLVGGRSVISPKVMEELKQIKSMTKVVRVGGTDRYETNVAVAKMFTAKPETLVFATGENYPDALTGSALVANEKGSLLLARPSGLSASTQTFVDSTRPALDAALVLGGTSALSASLDTKLASVLNAPLTVASSSANETPTSNNHPIALSSSATVSLAGISVPAIDGLVQQEKLFNGAVVSSLAAYDQTVELAPPFTISRIPLKGQSADTALASWFGVPEQYITAHQTIHETHSTLTAMPTIVPAQIVFDTDGDTLIMAEIRLSAELAAPVIEQIVSQF